MWARGWRIRCAGSRRRRSPNRNEEHGNAEAQTDVLPTLKYDPSPIQSPRVHGPESVRLIVVHTPEGAYAPMVRYRCRPSAQVSYHLLLREDGLEATQLLPCD